MQLGLAFGAIKLYSEGACENRSCSRDEFCEMNSKVISHSTNSWVDQKIIS